ncbi:MAG: translation initiation factor IF-3 [Nitrospinae bacterium CG11_big_fil_rev_8_21_14_0_20_45_15]|nr:MAG: translation initiation factor IF-3 [Nitrospinae bacterium CG11_big_fil_rev_8_21_14_0_20_45_15]
MIRAKEVSVIAENGDPLGTMSVPEALALAKDQEMDLVEVAPNAVPPVCRVMDYGKFKYRQSKRAHEAKKNQKIIHLKEVKFRPTTDEHDYDFKLKHVRRFIEAGDKVKVVIFFRGREIVHRNKGQEILDRIVKETEETTIVEQSSKQEGRTLMMVLAPNTKKK